MIPVTRKPALVLAAVATWLLPGHLAVLALLAYVLFTALASNTNTAKTRSIEARLNAHIAATAPAVSLVANGGTINGDLHITGTLWGVSGALTVGDATTFLNNAAVDGTLYGSGGPGGPLHVDSATTVDTLNISAGAFFLSGVGITRQAAPGTITGTGTNSQLTNAVNSIISQLKNTNWFT